MLPVLELNSRLDRTSRNAVIYSVAALALAVLLMSSAPPAVDQAAHSHLQQIFDAHGFELWDNSWYLGRYTFVNYSFAFYLLSYLIGLKTVAAISVAATTGLISLLSDRYFPGSFNGNRRLSLLVVPCMVLTGAWPFLLGVAFVLLALLMYSLGRKFLFLVVSTLVFLSSPLALLALVLLIAAAEVPFELVVIRSQWGNFARRTSSSFYLDVAVLLVLVQFVSTRAFPDHGHYPYWFSDLVAVEIFALLCYVLVPKNLIHALQLRMLIIGYGLANLLAFLTTSNLGSNATRVIDFAFPIIVALLGLRKVSFRVIFTLLLAPVLVWNLMPLTQILSGAIYQTSKSAFWSRLWPALERNIVPGSRIELVDTSNHQGDYYLPAMGFTIARGWFRQDDFPQNQIFYGQQALTQSQYLSWLRRSGVSLVVLPPGPYDFSSVGEAQLISSGKSGLLPIAEIGRARIFKVPDPASVVRAPGGTYIGAKIGLDSVTINVLVPGTYNLSLFYSPYFKTSGGTVCANAEGMTTWIINNPGPHRLIFDLSVRKVIEVLTGGANSGCG